MALRSFLLTPINCERSIEAASRSGADVIMLDLAAGGPEARRSDSRALLPERIQYLISSGQNVVVRINGGALAPLDIRAAAIPGVRALIMPKVENTARLSELHNVLSAAEEANGRARGSVRTVAVIDHPNAVLDAREFACANTRIMALGYWACELAAVMGVRPQLDSLAIPAQMVALAARGAGLQCVGAIGKIPEAATPKGLMTLATKAKSIGFTGAVIADPTQVETINAVFSPEADDLEQTNDMVVAFEPKTRSDASSPAGGGAVVERPSYWLPRSAPRPLGE